jgi:hypothetical protein
MLKIQTNLNLIYKKLIKFNLISLSVMTTVPQEPKCLVSYQALSTKDVIRGEHVDIVKMEMTLEEYKEWVDIENKGKRTSTYINEWQSKPIKNLDLCVSSWITMNRD